MEQKDPPTPRDRTIVTHPSPASSMYVSSFGGFATQQGVLSQAAKLQEAVSKDGHSVITAWFYFASYDPPYRQVLACCSLSQYCVSLHQHVAFSGTWLH